MRDHPSPWLAVPSQPPYVLPCDSDVICAYNAKCRNENYGLQLNVLPEPFIGITTAPVVLLILNPGFDDRDPQDHARTEFQALIRNNYSQNLSSFPFYSLDPSFENGGRRWWEKKLRRLLNIFERKQLARAILCVDYFPYHSRRFPRGSLEVPSQEYGFGLVRSAIARGAVVVIMRATKLWMERIPELGRYSRAFTLKNPRNVVISPRNCPEGFDAVVSAIRDGNNLGMGCWAEWRFVRDENCKVKKEFVGKSRIPCAGTLADWPATKQRWCSLAICSIHLCETHAQELHLQW